MYEDAFLFNDFTEEDFAHMEQLEMLREEEEFARYKKELEGIEKTQLNDPFENLIENPAKYPF